MTKIVFKTWKCRCKKTEDSIFYASKRHIRNERQECYWGSKYEEHSEIIECPFT